jgi:hypothetical protein
MLAFIRDTMPEAIVVRRGEVRIRPNELRTA